ncbi:MAG: hypothetical protein R6X31_10710 [Anaerolineae bacterium]
MRDELELIRAYVPEAEYLDFYQALRLAERRDEQAANDMFEMCVSVEDAECQPARS